MQLIFSRWVEEKLVLHRIDPLEVEIAFFNHDGPWFIDDRESHLTSPPTAWAILDVEGVAVKVCIVPFPNEGVAFVKTAFPASRSEEDEYERQCSKS